MNHGSPPPQSHLRIGDGNACYRYSPLGIGTKFSGIGKFKPIRVKGLPRQLHCKFTVVSPPDSEYDSEACPQRGLRKLEGRCYASPISALRVTLSQPTLRSGVELAHVMLCYNGRVVPPCVDTVTKRYAPSHLNCTCRLVNPFYQICTITHFFFPNLWKMRPRGVSLARGLSFYEPIAWVAHCQTVVVLILLLLYINVSPNFVHAMMHRAIRSVGAPQPALWSSHLPSKVGRRTCGVRFRQSEPENQDDMEKIKIQKKEKLSSVERDEMSTSFGVAYATRSDEEGFGGIYGGNQSLGECDKEAAQENHNDYERTQGSDVKEKEKARHQKEKAPHHSNAE
ncbi:hypothetical protein AAG906_033257 [Vitis piasezkii]